MPYEVVEFQQTPNPNALKCVLDRPIAPAPRSYRSREDVRDDPAAAALFALPGVTNLLFLDAWVTVGKSPETRWATLKPAITRALRECP
jgi:hypothetical protein